MDTPKNDRIISIDEELVKGALPKREKDTNKASFGRISLFVGSEKYFGAAALALEAALRGGVGYATLVSVSEVNKLMKLKFPEALYKERKPFSEMEKEDIEALAASDEVHGNIVIGPGCEASAELCLLLLELMNTDGGFILIDADAINSLALDRERAINAIKNSRRRVILTPHPLEFSRLSGLDIPKGAEARVSAVKRFYSEIKGSNLNHVLLLKGAGTLVYGGDMLFINTSGSSALAKAGSGDVLSGLIGALLAQNPKSDTKTVASAAYLHGAAADRLSLELSEYGVIPSDLPCAIAKEIKRIIK